MNEIQHPEASLCSTVFSSDKIASNEKQLQSTSIIDIPVQESIDRNPLMVSPEMPLLKTIELMSQGRNSCNLEHQTPDHQTPENQTLSPLKPAFKRSSYVLVTTERKLQGIVTERDIVRLSALGNDFSEITVADVMTQPVITLQESDFDSPFIALGMFQKNHIRHLPILDESGEIVGVATPHSVRQVLRSLDLFKLHLVGEVMSTKLTTANPDASILELAQLMAINRVSCVVITQAEQINTVKTLVPVGIVTESDIVQFRHLELKLEKIQAQEAMSTPLLCLNPQDNLWSAHQTMERLRVRRLVVKDDQGNLVGILTQTSILAALDPPMMQKTITVLTQQLEAVQNERMQWLEKRASLLEGKIQSSESRFRAIFEQAFQFIALLNTDGTLIEMNQTAINFCGAQPEDFIHRPIWDLHCWQTLPNNQEKLKQAVISASEGEFIRFEAEVIGQNQLVTVDFSLRPLRDKDGNVDMLIAEGQDITERKRTEAALAWQASETKFRAMADSAAVLIWISDQNQQYIYLNKKWLDYTGWAQEGIYYRWAEGIHPEDIQHCLELYNCAFETHQSFEVEYRLRRFDGEYRWHIESGTPRFNDNHEFLGYVGSCFDINQRKETEETLVQQVAAIEASSEGIAILKDNLFLFVNQAHLSIFGYEQKEELIGKSWEILYSQTELSQIKREIFPILTQQRSWHGEVLAMRKDGSSFPENLSLSLTDKGLLICVCRDISESKAAENFLRKSESHLRTAQRIGNFGSWEFDVASREIQWSEEVFRIFGLDPQAGAPSFEGLQELLHPDDRDPHQKIVQQAIERCQSYEIEIRTNRSDQLVYIFARGEPILDATGQTTHLMGTLLDITARRKAEIAGEARFRYMADFAPVLIWLSDSNKCFTHVNQMWLEFSGRAMEQELGQGWAEGIHPDDLHYCLEIYDQAFEACQRFTMEYRRKRFDGEYRWLTVRGVPRFSADGDFLGFIGSCVDISDRIHAENQTRELSHRLSLATSSAQIGIWDYDPVNNTLIWDDRMFQLYGIESQDFGGAYEAWQRGVHPDDIYRADTEIQLALTGEQDFHTEFKVLWPNGQIHIIEAHAVVLRDNCGQAIRMIGVNWDITERKLAEERIQQYTDQLKASNKELEAFSYSVSHDLRAPLRAIDGFSKALLEDCGDILEEDAKLDLDCICENVNRMGDLIDDLLNLSKVSRTKLDYKNCNLSNLAQKILTRWQRYEPERSVNIVVEPNILVFADQSLMGIVLENLLNNAWKFTSHHLTANITVGIQSSGQESIYFVQDDGAGFDMAYQHKLFGVFQRLHQAHEFPGTGIGLASVQRAIHRHGGKVWAQGAIEQGATFYFTIPKYTTSEEN